jgi:hypothetical protein
MHELNVCCYTPNLNCHYRQLSYWQRNSRTLTFTLFQDAIPKFFNNTGFINTSTHRYTTSMYTRIDHRHKHKPWVTKYFSVRCHTMQMADKYMQYMFLRYTAARFPSTTENSPSQFSANVTFATHAAFTGSYYRPPLHLPPFIQASCLSRTHCTKHLPSLSSPPTRWQPLSRLTARYGPLRRLTAEFIHGSPPCSKRRVLHCNLLMGHDTKITMQ